MRILVAGDTHGGSGYVWRHGKRARDFDCAKIIVVGDFGMWPGNSGMRFLDDCQAVADEFNLKIYALPGNHEDHDQWEWWLNSAMPKDDDGFTHVRSKVVISPKVHNWKWDDKRFFITGGAVSIDRSMRTLGKSYWENETFSEDDLSSVEKYQGPDIDYLFSHDCSNFTPWGFNLVADPLSQENRRRIDRAIKALRPRRHFHGHMHHKYEWVNTESHGQRYAFGQEVNDNWNGKNTVTYGLDCNNEADCWGVLDTKKDAFGFEGKGLEVASVKY